MEIFPSYGGAPFAQHTKKMIRLILKGCVNRPFFHISVQEEIKDIKEPVIEQLGSYDPMPNQYNEKLVAINFDRLEYWLRQGAEPSKGVKKVLGLCGYFPIHPDSFEEAFRRRKSLLEEIKNLKIKAAEIGVSIDENNKSSEELSDATLTEEQSSKNPTEENVYDTEDKDAKK